MTSVGETSWRRRLADRLPFYYGWVIVANTVVVSFSTRAVMAVAVLSVFVVPMTSDLGWSRGLFSGAVSLGGLAAVVTAPLIGRWVDRYGAGVLIAASSVITGVCAVGLAFITLPWMFYCLYVPGRMTFSGPLELGIPTAISNWFIRRRPLGLAVDTVAKGAGLSVMPLVAQFIIIGWDWRVSWAAIGLLCLAVGVIPCLLFIARRPEDMGLEPDPAPQTPPESEAVSASRRGNAGAPSGNANPNASPPGSAGPNPGTGAAASASTNPAAAPSGGANLTAATEANLTLAEALRTRAFWLVCGFAAMNYMSQGGISLHQVPHFIHQGIAAPLAALTASSYAFAQIPGGLFWSALARRVPVRFLLAAAALLIAAGALGISVSSTFATAMLTSGLMGFAVGGLHLLVRLTWADYYGRQHLGSIRGVTLSAQVSGQAMGPVIAGFMFDYTDSYQLPFWFFASGVLLAGLLALAATPPSRSSPPPLSTS